MDPEPVSPPPPANLPRDPTLVASPPVVTLGDRLILALWVAAGMALARAALQAVVDATADDEHGMLLLEHFVEHVVEATARSWWLVPLLAVLPRPERLALTLLRGGVVTFACLAFLVGWPDGEPRYTPGVDSMRGWQGWGVAVATALACAAFERFLTSPERSIFRWAPPTRFATTAAVLLIGGAALLSVVVVLERRRFHLQLQAIEIDLLDGLAQSRLLAAPDGRVPTVGSLMASRGDVGAGGNRPSLVLPVGASAEYEVELPRHARFLFSLGVDRSSIVETNPPSQLLEFRVTIDGREEIVAALRPQERGEDRRWLDYDLDLSARAEHVVKIGLELRGEGAAIEQVRAGFGRPRVVRREWRRRVVASKEKMNVVLIAVDALRPDHLGCYGYGRPTSPALDALARDGVLYEQALSASTWGWPAVATLLSGLYPPTHGVDDFDRCFLSDSLVTLPELLAESGCTTLGATANPLIARSKNFDQGFADWREFPLKEGERVVDQFVDWIHRYGAWQFFSFLHLHDPQRPFHPPEEVALRFAPAEHVATMRAAITKFRHGRSTPADPARAIGPVAAEEDVLPSLPESAWIGLYDGEVRYVDEQIARVLTQLRRNDLLDRTVVVVVGTYGETLAMGAAPAAGSSLARELRHVPLIIRDPRQSPRRIAEAVDVTFLASTLATIAGSPPVGGGVASVAFPPFGNAAPHFSYFHTARGVVPGASGSVELIGLEGNGATLVTRLDGTVVDYVAAPGRAGGRDADERREALLARLARWYELTQHDAVARPFERIDSATRYALDQLAEPATPADPPARHGPARSGEHGAGGGG